MRIQIPERWRIPEREATPEAAYLSRRVLLAALGGVGLAPAAPAPYVLDRDITREWVATSYNNFYELHPTDKTAAKHRGGKYVTRPWTIEVSGMGRKPVTLDLDEIERRMPKEERLYRHRCVEAWAMAVPWMGFSLASFLKSLDPPGGAKYVRFESVNRPEQLPGMKESPWYPWPYHEALRMDEAMNPLAFFVTGLYGKPLPKQNGAPWRVVVPWKYGYKGPKAVVKIEFHSARPKTFWNTAVPAEYGFYSNVNPERPHPRWSQAVERMIPNMERRPTTKYNGYGQEVAALYRGDEF